MNSEQVLLVVAAIGVLFFAVMGALGSKRNGKVRAAQRDARGPAAAQTSRVNRAQRRKKH